MIHKMAFALMLLYSVFGALLVPLAFSGGYLECEANSNNDKIAEHKHPEEADEHQRPPLQIENKPREHPEKVMYMGTDEQPVLADPVPGELRDWDRPFPDYHPTYYVAPGVLWEDEKEQRRPVWADSEEDPGNYTFGVFDGHYDRRSSSGKIRLDESGYPLNPQGRTGFRGRGLMGRWGVNHCADTAVTRWHRGTLQLIMIKRRRGEKWALPGGYLEAGESVASGLEREFFEEALGGPKWGGYARGVLQHTGFWTRGELVFSGQGNGAPKMKEKGEKEKIPDKKQRTGGEMFDKKVSTDNAWVETTVVNFHDHENMFERKHIVLVGADDALEAQWKNLDADFWRWTDVFKPHRYFIEMIAAKHGVYWSEQQKTS